MNDLKTKTGVWFVYDGGCPICDYAAHALRIKEAHGQLHLINAREDTNDPLLQEILDRRIDLDDGMVILCEGEFYHGKDALKFTAKYADRKGFFNWSNKCLFWSDKLSALVYPWMRASRNLLLRRLKIAQIDNLDKNATPIFRAIFGEHWDALPPVIKRHYANRPYSTDKVIVEGVLDVTCSSYMKLLRPFYRLLGTIPAVTENQAPVTVHFDSSPNSKAFHFNRIFHFRNRSAYAFRSCMVQVSGNEVIEIMHFGVCWRMQYSWADGKVTLRHKGYALKALGHFIPLPITCILGRGDAEEIAVDDDHFDMNVRITHPLFGEVYSYAGRFEVTQSL